MPPSLSVPATVDVDQPVAEQIGVTGGHGPSTVQVTGGALSRGALPAAPFRRLQRGGERASMLQNLGAAPTVLEATHELLPGFDRELAGGLHAQLGRRMAIATGTLVTAIEGAGAGNLATDRRRDTEAQPIERFGDVEVTRHDDRRDARAQIPEETEGLIKLVHAVHAGHSAATLAEKALGVATLGRVASTPVGIAVVDPAGCTNSSTPRGPLRGGRHGA